VNGRSIKRIKTKDNDGFGAADQVGKEARCELDTRADTTCAGVNCRPLYFTGQNCEAYGFHSDLTPISDMPIATVATAWSNPLSGESFILIINEVLYFGSSLDHSLVNPNQLRNFRIDVYDNPYDRDPDRSMGIMLSETYCLPLRSCGSTIYFSSWFPTDEELETYRHIVLTSDRPWDPQNLVMPGGDLAEQILDDDRFVQQVNMRIAQGDNRHHKIYKTDCALHSIDGITEQILCERMINSVNIGCTRQITKLQSSSRHSIFSPELVASIFGCGIGTAKDILAATTQKGIRHSVMPLNR